jgi:hypothetical protein
MKYTKMLCLVNQDLQVKFMKIINKQNKIIFTNNYNDLKNKISDDSYIAVSLSIARKNLSDFKTLLQGFPNQKIRIIFDEERFSCDVINAFTEENKRCNHFSVEKLISDFNQKAHSQ